MGCHAAYLFLSRLFEVPSITNFLGIHMMHGQERLAPMVVAKGQSNWLFTVEQWVCLFDFLACLHNSQGHEVVTTALVSSHHIVLVCQVRDRHHLLHGVAVNNITAATVGERLALEHRNTSDIWSLCTIDPVTEVPHQVRPEDVSIGLSKHVPLLVGAHLPCLLDHVKELVLIKIPAILASHVGCTILLGNWTIDLCLVEIELLAASSDVFLDILEDIIDLVFVNLLVLPGLVSCISDGTVA